MSSPSTRRVANPENASAVVAALQSTTKIKNGGGSRSKLASHPVSAIAMETPRYAATTSDARISQRGDSLEDSPAGRAPKATAQRNAPASARVSAMNESRENELKVTTAI